MPCLLSLIVLLSASGCSVKQTIKVDVPQNIRQAKTAGFDDLLGIIKSYDRINSLSCNEMYLTLTSSKKMDVGELEKYHTVRGYILLRRPDATHLVLLMPVTKSTLFNVLSIGDKLSVWFPKENKFYEGSNSAKELVVEDPSGAKQFSIPIRGTHIFDAIFPQSVVLDSPDVRIGLEEQADARASYYVLSFVKEEQAPRIRILRKIWIERAGLTIARQQVFGDEGQVVSDIAYSNDIKIEGLDLPLRIHIDRPVDGYMLDLRFGNWNINPPDLTDNAFELLPPPGAQIIHLKEKGRSSTS